MGNRDELEHVTEPIKVEGVTIDESTPDDHVDGEEDKLTLGSKTTEKNKNESMENIHLVVDKSLPVFTGQTPSKNHVKDSFKFIQICDNSDTAEKPVQNGHIPLNKLAQTENGNIPQHANIEKVEKGEVDKAKEGWNSNCNIFWCMFLLLIANLLNYMDRVTIAGVLLDVQNYYSIDNSQAGLLQTAFICSYMILSPIFGYLGDRYNRKLIMACGIAFWSVVTFLGSFVPHNMFWLFLFMRGMVGVGEASYSTIAPTIIADLFVKDKRTKALSVFYFAIPIGSGLGYIVGSNVAKAFGAWQWALRVTPGLGILCVLGIIFIVKEPPRGASEGGSHISSTSWSTDLKHLCKNKSYILSSFGFTCVAFVAGALSLWAPAFMQYSIRVQQDYEEESMVNLKFGIITCVAGFLGVAIGSESARRLRPTYSNVDPIVCAFGLMWCAPFLFLVMVISKYNTPATWVLILISEIFLCLNWALVADIILYIVIPTRRSTASAFQILLSHALGDAGSPYLIGVLSDAIKKSHVPDDAGEVAANFISLQYSLYLSCFICVIGGGLFLATAIFVREDRAKADRAVKGTAISREGDGDESPTADDVQFPRLPPEGAPDPDNHLQNVVT